MLSPLLTNFPTKGRGKISAVREVRSTQISQNYTETNPNAQIYAYEETLTGLVAIDLDHILDRFLRHASAKSNDTSRGGPADEIEHLVDPRVTHLQRLHTSI